MATEKITQDMFPGCFLEGKWSRGMVREKACMYAMRLAIGGRIILAPNGWATYTGIQVDGMTYILHNENYFDTLTAYNHLSKTFLFGQGYNVQSEMICDIVRMAPDIIISGIERLLHASESLFDVPPENTRILWLLPDEGPCGHYRSVYPSAYSNSLPDIFSESLVTGNQDSMDWFDAFFAHRWPSKPMMTAFSHLRISGKVMVYEYDDDLFNIPEFNPNHVFATDELKQTARQCAELADIIVVATENLKEKSGRPEVTYVCPNLVDLTKTAAPIFPSRVINPIHVGYSPFRKNKKTVFRGPGKELTEADVDPQVNYDPVRILWAGSATHDEDLRQAVPAIVSIGKKYGIAVRFFFLGYCPKEFLSASADNSNGDIQLVVKPEFSHFISYYHPVMYRKYHEAIAAINPDISLAPICPITFNASKSNLKVIELGASGVPTIASDFGPYQFIEHMHDGMLVNKQSQWFEFMDLLISNVELRMNLAKNIFKRVSEDFSWQSDSENRRKWDVMFARLHEISTDRKKQLPVPKEVE